MICKHILWITLFATIVEGDLKVSFSIATTPKYRGWHYSFPWIALFYPWYVPYNAECSVRLHQVPFLWIFGMSRPEIKPRSTGPLTTKWRVFINGPEDQGSITGRVVPKTQKWYLMPPCLILSIIRYGSRVKWNTQRNGVAPSPIHRYSSYWKGNLRIALDYGRQLFFTFIDNILKQAWALFCTQLNGFKYCYITDTI